MNTRNTRTEIHTFRPAGGGTEEFHVMISVTDTSLCFENQLENVMQAYSEASSGRSVHFRRFFLSDAANQYPVLAKELGRMAPAPTSIIQQAPLDGTKVALWMYCTSPFGQDGAVLRHNGYSHHWHGSLENPGGGPYDQTRTLLGNLDKDLHAQGLSLACDTLRTWLFVRDVDVDYMDVVKARKDYFDSIGLTQSTHYIASTGIQGQSPDSSCRVVVDACSVGGLDPGQTGYLYASDHLNRTSDYGVTFERGTRVDYGDRRHIFISGTASIDSRGEVMYPGDVRSQTRRMLENIDALLSEAGAGFNDVAMAIVYLRDRADYIHVREIVSRICPAPCVTYVHAPVCRPAWLVEMECIAVTDEGNPAFRPF
ncbi:MAG: hypothetical protein K6G79_01460 [Bacteroidales bacterium]|nr:hypothetical protein [Bacteroidales bacterium]